MQGQQEFDIFLNMDKIQYFDIPRNSTIDLKGVSTVKLKTSGNEKVRYTAVLTAGVQRVQDGFRAFLLTIMFL